MQKLIITEDGDTSWSWLTQCSRPQTREEWHIPSQLQHGRKGQEEVCSRRSSWSCFLLTKTVKMNILNVLSQYPSFEEFVSLVPVNMCRIRNRTVPLFYTKNWQYWKWDQYTLLAVMKGLIKIVDDILWNMENQKVCSSNWLKCYLWHCWPQNYV